jgi:hypothetical protein
MSDIVERLRSVEWDSETESWMPRTKVNPLQLEAADEIERLREALRGVIRVPDKAALDAARAALGEDKE